MKLVNDEGLVNTNIGNFNFSCIRPDKLGATEYTLVTIVTDKTGSVSSFADELRKMKVAVVDSCQKSPRAEFLMLRSVEFNSSVNEEHGFTELKNINPKDYPTPNCFGLTALYDAAYWSLVATNEYAKTLTSQDFNVNAVVFIITDGIDNDSSANVKMVADELKRGVNSEFLESINTVLIGVNDVDCKVSLERFKKEAGLTQYVSIPDATPSTLAKLADFVSRSISSQSQSLGTGGASQALTF